MINKRFLKDCIKMLYKHSEEVLENKGQLAYYRWAHVAKELEELLEEINNEL